MTATASPTVKNQELVQFGLVESEDVTSMTDFTLSKVNERKANTAKKKEDFVNTFICHLIFYAVFCVSLVLHILIDLGFGSFIKKKIPHLHLIGFRKETVMDKSPAFA